MKYHRLTEKQIAAAKKTLSDGGGLWLKVQNGSCSWFFKQMINGKFIMLGLGPCDRTNRESRNASLTRARAKAKEFRDMIADGIDPRDVVRDAREQEQIFKGKSFVEYAYSVLDKLEAKGEWRGRITASQKRSYLRRYIEPVVKALAPVQITPRHVAMILEPIWQTYNHTAKVVAHDLYTYFAHAMADQLVPPDFINPALIKGTALEVKFKPLRNRETVPHRHIEREKAPGLYAAFVADGDLPIALCARMLMITFVRLSVVLDATWGEFDMKARVWQIPAGRMKTFKPHYVPICDELTGILEALRGSRRPSPESRLFEITPKLIRRYIDRAEFGGTTAHGFRHLFTNWSTAANIPLALRESAMAHAVAGVEGNYRTDAFLPERRQLADTWVSFLRSELGKRPARKAVAGAKVVALPTTAKRRGSRSMR